MADSGPGWLPLVVLIPAAWAYARGCWQLIQRGDRWPWPRMLAAALGWCALVVALLPPLSDAMTFPAQVVQHLLLAMFAPLLLTLSEPVVLALRALPPSGRRRLRAALRSRAAGLVTAAPMVLLLEVGGMYAYYLTPLFAYGHEHPWLHYLIHAHMFLAGLLFSWYVIDPLPRRRSLATAVTLLLLAAACHDVLAKLMYAHLWPHDAGSAAGIRTGAQLMFYGGDAVEVLLALALMAQWYARTGRQWQRVQRRARLTSPST